MAPHSRTVLGDLNHLGGLGATTGLPMSYSKDPEDVFYTTDEPIESLQYLEGHISGKEAYTLDPLVLRINDEVRFPRQRLPTDLFVKLMDQINRYLPPCSNEKRGHRFKHKRIHVDRTSAQKLAGKPKSIMTSHCQYCQSHWTGLRYPLEVDERFPTGMSLFRQRTATNSTKYCKAPKFVRLLALPFYSP